MAGCSSCFASLGGSLFTSFTLERSTTMYFVGLQFCYRESWSLQYTMSEAGTVDTVSLR